MIIDTDPGIDDAMAIFYAALDPKIELLGLTSIFGNVTTPMATRNALRLAELAGLDVPVAQGALKPRAMPPITPSAHVHGEEGFGDIPADTPNGKAISESAAEYLCRMAKEHKSELIVCPIGPITNIADAIELDPEFATNVRQIVIMGGAVTVRGNVTPHAEANTYHDPHALNVVLASGADILIVGLDVTTTIRCDDDDFAVMEAGNPKLGGFLRRSGSFYLDFYESVNGERTCNLHDPAAVIACTNPELFEIEEMQVTVVESGEEIGNTIQSPDGHKVKVCIGCDAPAITNKFVEMF